MGMRFNIKRYVLTTLAIIAASINGLNAFASDNVLQAIQIDGVKDSYDIILKSDDTAELKKTIQAPNKMVLTLSGIRASKSINTIYHNTSTVDSVVVEPTGEDSVKILIQASNVNNADVKFDTLKTPLGLNSQKENADENSITLSGPVESYKPVYSNDALGEEETGGFSLSSIMSGTGAKYAKKALKSDKFSWMLATGLFMIVIMNGLKSIKAKDSDIKVGLSQSLKERELELNRQMHSNTALQSPISTLGQTMTADYQRNPIAPQPTMNYGLKAYQNETRSPYMSVDARRIPTPTPSEVKTPSPLKSMAQNIKKPVASPISNTGRRPAAGKTANIDSMKFLESMTKIYEKNGRSDLAQGLKSNMKKAQAVNIA